MIITLYGTRGSVPVSSPETAKFGGNTTCIQVETKAGDCIIIDAGTGIRTLGKTLMEQGRKDFDLCFTHAHWDHIQGLPFFSPLFNPECSVCLRGPKSMGEGIGLKRSLAHVFNGRNFPLELESLLCQLEMVEIEPVDSFYIGTALIETCPTVHQGGCVSYRISADGWSFVFSGDHEWCDAGENLAACEKFEEFIRGADMLIADGPYTKDNYEQYRGWGHSSMDSWPEIAVRNGIGHLVITHHDPANDDETLQDIYDTMVQRFSNLPLTIEFAADGMVLKNTINFSSDAFLSSSPLSKYVEKNSGWLDGFSQEIANFSEVGMILDKILAEARAASGADAGTIYLVEGDDLVFSCTQNASLFSEAESMRNIYHNMRIPIDTGSIAGFVASTLQTLKINDVRQLPKGAPFTFNDSLDSASGYRTISMLVVPLMINNKAIGVMQLINRLDDTGPVPFSDEAEFRVRYLSVTAVNAIERGLEANKSIMRMLAITELHDPAETSGHVRRVGAIAAEIYQQWAMNHQVPIDGIRTNKDHIRLAAMLHDIGKAGIPETILKKEDRLTKEERQTMEQHCVCGQRLFDNLGGGVDAMVYDVVLHHHQRWDGKGYTGAGDVPALSGDSIPLAARITTIADVYDSLVSDRCYRDACPEDRAMQTIKEGSGTLFDPELVEAFLEIPFLIAVIRSYYPD